VRRKTNSLEGERKKKKGSPLTLILSPMGRGNKRQGRLSSSLLERGMKMKKTRDDHSET